MKQASAQDAEHEHASAQDAEHGLQATEFADLAAAGRMQENHIESEQFSECLKHDACEDHTTDTSAAEQRRSGSTA